MYSQLRQSLSIATETMTDASYNVNNLIILLLSHPKVLTMGAHYIPDVTRMIAI